MHDGCCYPSFREPRRVTSPARGRARVAAELEPAAPGSVCSAGPRSRRAAAWLVRRPSTSQRAGQAASPLASEAPCSTRARRHSMELLVDAVPGEQLTTMLADAPSVRWPCSSPGRARGRVLSSSRSEGPNTTGRAVESPPVARARRRSPSAARGRGRHRRNRASGMPAGCSPHASLAVQRVLGVPARPLLIQPGEEAMLEASRDAGVLVVGLSERWHRQGLGAARLRLARERHAHRCLLVRSGLRPGGLAPPATLTRFTWSIRSSTRVEGPAAIRARRRAIARCISPACVGLRRVDPAGCHAAHRDRTTPGSSVSCRSPVPSAPINVDVRRPLRLAPRTRSCPRRATTVRIHVFVALHGSCELGELLLFAAVEVHDVEVRGGLEDGAEGDPLSRPETRTGPQCHASGCPPQGVARRCRRRS